ncbi:nuclear transport factor 2 family protein [Zunongwangia endophytica]|uniref:Nuclear transport factor 2 family protein n=1 Tax=Zunongwangia endophytica TaxID=1808945 RepID=A0ABV8HH24_9FLAO|nr:nuclear transport factor 2 family protein [Zunongwangia endophytica]MDN3594158.1 nuclear transport factor 2 family protein [Zunongwangia endophytica]
MDSKKEELLIDFNKAFASGNDQFMLDHVTDDFHWIMIGKKEVKGKENFSKTLKEMQDHTTDDLEFVDVIIHGNKGCVNGNMKIKTPNGAALSFSFCDVYEFNSDENKIQKMTTYVIDR